MQPVEPRRIWSRAEWERIFKDPMTTMAAIDRLVHHSVILDMMSVDSYRAEAASQQRPSPTRSKKSSSKRATPHEAVPSPQNVDTSSTSPQDDLDISANELVPDPFGTSGS